MLELMYAAGLRVSELVSLKQTEVDVHAGVVNCHGKGSKERRVPVGKSAIHWLQQYASVKAGYGKSPYANLFLNRGKPLTRQFAWATIKEPTQQRLVLRMFRHTLCVTALQLICCNTAPTRARSRPCLVTAIFLLLRSIHTLLIDTCARLTTIIIRARAPPARPATSRRMRIRIENIPYLMFLLGSCATLPTNVV